MHAELADRWAAQLEATPKHRRSKDFLRCKSLSPGGDTEQYSPLGVLADMVISQIPRLSWYYDKSREIWWLAPLTGKPGVTTLVEEVRQHCGLRSIDPAFNNGSLPVSTLAMHGLSWEQIAKLIRTHADQL